MIREDFIHYLWRYKKINSQTGLKTTKGEKISIFKTGDYLQQEGPDFFNAQIEIDHQKWAGNVEIHVKSSDWYTHKHETNNNYNNVILHVVWENDTEIFRKNNTPIPVLEVKNYVSADLFDQYQNLKSTKSWINCENQINQISPFVLNNWQERLFVERLEKKSKPITQILQESKNNWEATFFYFLAKNFGLNTNGEIFFKIAQSIPFNIIRKEGFEIQNIEALLLGRAGLLNNEKEDNYFKDLKSRWEYLQNKHQLQDTYIDAVQFFKHRPDNFPTIRLSQLAALYHTHQNLFSKIIQNNTIQSIYDLFNVSASQYWETHYQFDKKSPQKNKPLSKTFIDLIIINTIIPFRFSYYNTQGKETYDDIINLLEQIPKEKNTIINKFSEIGVQTQNAFQTQSLLQLKNEYCSQNKCLQCAIGLKLLEK